jgi:hypothetical protein
MINPNYTVDYFNVGDIVPGLVEKIYYYKKQRRI